MVPTQPGVNCECSTRVCPQFPHASQLFTTHILHDVTVFNLGDFLGFLF